jgi:hypothetical protein
MPGCLADRNEDEQDQRSLSGLTSICRSYIGLRRHQRLNFLSLFFYFRVCLRMWALERRLKQEHTSFNSCWYVYRPVLAFGASCKVPGGKSHATRAHSTQRKQPWLLSQGIGQLIDDQQTWSRRRDYLWESRRPGQRISDQLLLNFGTSP